MSIYKDLLIKAAFSWQSQVITPVILCGGSGTRLWPLSRASFPKQFVPLIQNKSLFELTLERVSALNNPLCITNEEHRFFVNDSLDNFLGSIGSSRSEKSKHASIFLEPSGRNTAAAMMCASLMPGVEDGDLLLFLPADHFIPDQEAFVSTILDGVNAANNGFIVTFGIQPSFPCTAYGYIQQGKSLDNFFKSTSVQKTLTKDAPSVFAVNKFIEKPVIEKAEQMLLEGGYFWNAGMFLCSAVTLRNALNQHAPDISDACRLSMNSIQIDGKFVRPNKESFLSCRSESIDYAVMEHFDKVAVVPFKGAWSDVGSWNAVATLTPEDQTGNRISGQGIAFQSNNTYINAPHRPVIALGTSDLVIVDTLDAILVASVDKVEQVKEVVVALKGVGQTQAVTHRKVARPWGWYDSIDMGERFQVKRIAVKPGASLSLQMHHHRAEHWIVVKGTAKVTNGDQVFLLEENQSTYIPIGAKHRLENPGKTDLEMIEVQSGGYLGEDDIVRFEDTYGRN